MIMIKVIIHVFTIEHFYLMLHHTLFYTFTSTYNDHVISIIIIRSMYGTHEK